MGYFPSRLSHVCVTLKEKRKIDLSPYFSLVVLAIVGITLGCNQSQFTQNPDAPAVPYLETSDLELRDYIKKHKYLAHKNPSSGIHRGRLAMIYDANSFTEEAIATYAQASRLDEEEVRWPYLKALAEASLGRLQNAVEAVDHALAIDVDYLPSHLAKGYWLIDLGKYEQACAVFDKAHAIAQESRELVPWALGKAQCLLELGDAEQAFSLVSNLPQESLNSYGELVELRIRRAIGGPTLATQVVASSASKAARLSWSDPIAGEVVAYTYGYSAESMLVQRLLESGRSLDALELVKSLRVRYPDKVQLYILQSAALVNLGKPDQAVTVLRKAILKFPGESLLHLNLGLLLEKNGEYNSALSHYQESLKLQKDFQEAVDSKASLEMAMGKFDAAKSTLRASLEVRPNDVGTLYLLGVMEGQFGNWQNAIGMFERAVSLEPGSGYLYASLALSLSELGLFDEATNAISDAIRLAPKDQRVTRATETLIANGILEIPVSNE